jgi:hypothetical protein
MGKVIFEVTQRHAEWTPLRPTKANVEPSRTSVLVEFHVPRPPLVVDETFLPRQESAMSGGYSSLHGFQLRDDKGVAYPISKLEVEGTTRLRLHFANALPTGGKFVINYGHPNAGELGAIAAFRQGPVVGGQPTMEMILEGDLSKRLKPLTDEGAFFVTNTVSGRAATRVPIRNVRYEAGDTFLRFETRELRNGVAFNAGQSIVAQRPFSYGNLRDSDDSSAMTAQVFGDASYGTRAGQPYPLWNWCVLFSGFPVGE